MTYLITFACYGCHLQGEAKGSVDRNHNLPGSRLVDFDRERLKSVTLQMEQAPYSLDETRRCVVLESIAARCENREWTLLAAHVRTNHVHLVIESGAQPERVMNDLKAFASRALNESGLDPPDRKRWARHGSTRWLWKRDEVLAAIDYVVNKQGQPMALYQSTEP